MKTQPIRNNVRSLHCQFDILGTYRDFFLRKDCTRGFSALLITDPMLLDVLDRTWEGSIGVGEADLRIVCTCPMEEVRARLRCAGNRDFLLGVAVVFPSTSSNTGLSLLISLDRLGGLRSSGDSNVSLNALNELV